MKQIYTYNQIVNLKNIYDINECIFDDFLNLYSELIEKDKIQPLYCQNNPTLLQNQLGNNVSYKKKSLKKIKFRKLNSNIWAPSVPKTEIDIVKKTIKIILNKITEKNYNVLIETLTCEINKFATIDTINILIKEILDKIIFDASFHNIYIKICMKLCDLRSFHENLIDIVLNDDEKYYWFVNTTEENNKLNGPYDSEEEIRNYIKKNINFKYYLLDELQNRFNERDEFILKSRNKELDEDDRLLYRKNVFAVLEFIGQLYNKKFICDKIVHLCLTNLLCYGNGQPKEEYIEGFCILWNTINSKMISPFTEDIIHQYFKYVIETINKFDWSVRIEFMLEDLIETYNKKYKKINMNANMNVTKIPEKVSKTKTKEELMVEEIENANNKFLKTRNVDDFVHVLNKYKDNVSIILDITLYSTIELDFRIQKLYVEVYKKCKFITKNMLYDALASLVLNIDDIILDIPHAKQNMMCFISLLEYPQFYQNLLLELDAHE